MQFLVTILAILPTFSNACQRDFPDRYIDSSFTQSIQHLPERAVQPFPPTWAKNEQILHEAFDSIEIETWASYYTHGAHLAGRNKSMAVETGKKWTSNGVPASLIEYEVFLNYPVSQSLVLNLGNGSRWEASLKEDPLEQDETTRDPESVPAFHGYSASGEVEAEYVYAGRGSKDEFAALLAANVTLEGKIALIKYGGPFRGVKVKNAEANGMVGVVIFTDPGDDGPQQAKGDKTYPDGPARNPSSIQRGSVAYIDRYIGDPTTPGYPSKPGVARAKSPSNLPKVPSLPISQKDALPILNALDGHGKIISGSTGGLNAMYSTGPAPSVTLSLSNRMESDMTTIWNVIGIINGTNTDETIIIGNHRDAWVVGGAADPNSGTAMLVEITRAFGALLETGWKPKRNIVFASWDAEEYALVGSTEWVEEYAPWLADTAISYLNIDIAVSGGLPGASATPELRGIAQDVMKKVIYGNRTLYDAWYSLYRFRPEDNGFGDLGSGSDYTAFLQLGIGALDFGFDGGRNDPVYHYHSNYDSFHWMKTFVDPTFSIHTTAGQFITLLAYRLADDALIPFDIDAYSRNLGYWVRDMTAVTMGMPNQAEVQRKINLSTLINSQKAFQNVANAYVKITSSEDFLKNATRIEDTNRRLKKLQRLFVKESGLPGRPFYKNALYAPNRNDGYKAQTFPGSIEGLNDGNLTQTLEWNNFLTEAINTASKLLTLT